MAGSGHDKGSTRKCRSYGLSKIHTALQKITAAGEKKAADSRTAASVKSAIRSEKEHRQSTPLQYKQQIEVNVALLAENGITVSGDHARELRDEMRRIKWPVLANAFGDQSKEIERSNVVMVASATSGEGKTFTAVNLAMSIAAEKDFDVLLVDGDIAKSHASELFGLTEYAGVTDYLSGEVPHIMDVIVGTDVPGLSLLPAGRADEHASELIASNRMSGLVTDLSELVPNTVVLFDSSPILQTNESQVLSRNVGQVLLVVAASKTPQPAVKEAVSLLGPDVIVNAIFNGMKSSFGKKYRLGGYYGYHYQH